VQILTLDDHFATEDPGEAAEKLLKDISAMVTTAN
jgi:hypothetical protein